MSRPSLRSCAAAGAAVALCAFTSGALPEALPAQTVPVVLHLAGQVGDAPFRCDREYTGIGVSHAAIRVSDFRLYVHDVSLLTGDGGAVPLTLDEESPWQAAGVALVDFEDGAGACANGTAEMRTVVRGTVPAGAAPTGGWRGVRFTLGVPFALNHADQTTAPTPLSLSRLFWSWNGGYKFLRLDTRARTAGDSVARPWVLHLGSTGCTPSGSASAVPTMCAQPNRAVVTLDGFDPARDVVVVDVAELLGAADLAHNQPKTAAGCMSGPDDGDCAPLFASLGLPFGDASPAPKQRVFRVVRRTSASTTSSAGVSVSRSPNRR